MPAKSSRGSTGRRWVTRGRSPGRRPLTVSAFDAGIRLMARRPYAGAELSRRLLDMGYEAAVVKPALETFAELGYIDDATFAENIVRRRSAKRGPRAIAAELTARGVEADVVQRAVGRFDREAQLQAAMRLVRRVPGSGSAATYEELLEKAAPKLLRRGFSHAIAWAACRAIWTGASDTVGV